jgi:O-antigen ligase
VKKIYLITLTLLLATVSGFFFAHDLAIVPALILGGLVFIFFLTIIIPNPKFGLLALIFALPFERIPSMAIGGTTVRMSQIILGGLIITAIARLIKNRHAKIKFSPYFYPYILFIISMLLSFQNMENLGRGVMVFTFILFTSLTIWIVPSLLKTSADLDKVIRVLFIVTILISIFGLYQFAGDMIGLPTSLTGLRELYTKIVFGYPRVQSTELEPLYLANFLIIPLTLAFTFVVRRANYFSAWMNWGVIGFAGLAFILTISRGGYLGLAFSFLLVILASVFVFLRPKLIFGITTGLIILSVVAVVALNVSDIGQKTIAITEKHFFEATQTASTQFRFNAYSQALEAFSQHPITGVGIGNFGPWVANYPDKLPVSGWAIVNNQTLESLAETGVVGLAALVIFILILLIRSVAAFFHATDPKLRAVTIGLFAAMIGVLVQYQFFSTLYVMHIWVLTALMIAVQNIILIPDKSE